MLFYYLQSSSMFEVFNFFLKFGGWVRYRYYLAPTVQPNHRHVKMSNTVPYFCKKMLWFLKV